VLKFLSNVKWRWTFGQYNVEATLLGLGLWVIAGCGIAFGWFGAWGYVLWVPLIAFGLIFVCFVGHFLLFWLPLVFFKEVIERWRKES
jgi:hypothetical protein